MYKKENKNEDLEASNDTIFYIHTEKKFGSAPGKIVSQ